MDDQQVESAIQAAGLTAARVTPAQIDAKMESLRYESWVVPNTTTTIVCAVLPDGFTVGIGTSAPASPANFNAAIGFDIAKGECQHNARDKLWELEGYVLKQKLNAGGVA